MNSTSDIAIDFEPMQDDELEILEALMAELKEVKAQLSSEYQSRFNEKFNEILGETA